MNQNSTLIQRGKKEGFIQFTRKGKRVYYPHSRQDFLLTPEEEVRIDVYLQLVLEYGYPPECITMERKVKMGSGYKFVDIVVFKSKEHARGEDMILIECKRAKVSANAFKEAEKQGFSYEYQLRCAEYLWVTSGDRNAYYRIKPDKREGRKFIPIKDLPTFSAKDKFLYKLKDTFSSLKFIFGATFGKYIKTQFQKPWASKLLVYSLILTFLGLLTSWVAGHLITPSELVRDFLEKQDYHYGHIYWFVPIVSAFIFVGVFHKKAFPSLYKIKKVKGRGRKSKRQQKMPLWVRLRKLVFVSFAIVLLSLLLTEALFDVAPYCDGCRICQDWACWWSDKHFRTFEESWRFMMYFVPFLVGVIPQGISVLIVSWVVEWLFGEKK
jgi:hypothetical protein